MPRLHRAARGAAVAILAALGLAGCAAGSATAPTPAATPGLPFDAAAVEAAFLDAAEATSTIGAFLYLRTPDGAEFEAAYGSSEHGGGAAPTADMSFRVGSNTKTWTGTVILQLVDEGRISLDDTIDAYFPDAPGAERITIAMLLDMRSGLYNYTDDPEWAATASADFARVWSSEELIAIGLSHDPYFEPGTSWHYSNTNTVMLGAIAERLEREPLHEIVEERLFAPLGLERTKLPAPDDATLTGAPEAHGYAFLDPPHGLTPTGGLTDEDLAAWRAGELAPEDMTNANPSWAWAAGAGVSTARELADWVEALTDGTFLSAELQERRMTELGPVVAPDGSVAEGSRYGLGIADFGGWIGHNGSLPGYQSHMVRHPDTGVTLVVWANLSPAVDGSSPADAIAAAVKDAIAATYAD